MIFEYQNQVDSLVIENVVDLILFRKLGIYFWFSSSIFTLAYSVYRFNRYDNKINHILSLILPTLTYVGTFIYTYGLVDEVAVNLEHPYNLYHFSRFSMSPNEMIDGTVEVVYYLLHLPFAQSYSNLILGNLGISFLIGWLHILILWRFKLTDSPLRNLILISCFSLSFPIITIFSSGFGNSLISLIFLISICLCLKKKISHSLLVSGILPLIRPDGILLSFTNLITILILFRKEIKKQFSPKIYYLFLGIIPFLSVALYLIAYKFAYGHFIPTPILFKSVKTSMFPLFSLRDFIGNLLLFWWIPLHGVELIILGTLIYIRFKYPDLIKNNYILKTLILYTLSTSFIFIFYSVTKSIMADYTGAIYFRYWVGFEFSLLLLLLVTISQTKIVMQSSSVMSVNFLPIFFMSVLLLTPAPLRTDEQLSWLNRYDGQVAGILAEEVLPQEFSISTSEMNTFGLMINRPVIDLWGYSTREIATSKVCNADKIRNNEDFFLQTLPDTFWAFLFTKYPDIHNFDRVEDSLLSYHHTNKQGNLLGDLNKVLLKYDIFFLKISNHQVAYFVRQNLRDRLISRLEEKNFQLLRSREIDMNYLNSIYNEQEKVQYQCS